jgi:hypothetical protein
MLARLKNWYRERKRERVERDYGGLSKQEREQVGSPSAPEDHRAVSQRGEGPDLPDINAGLGGGPEYLDKEVR